MFTRCFRYGERRLVIPLARAFSHSADGYLHLAITAMVWLIDFERGELFTDTLLLALLLERPLHWALKNSLRRRRPQDLMTGFNSLISAGDKFSFPSGHSSGAFLLATTLCLIYGGSCAAMLLWAVALR